MQSLHWPGQSRSDRIAAGGWMESRWLQDFLTLAETGHFTRAAMARHSSQAAFSRRIQQLEQWLGMELVDRSAFPARLTEAGERFRVQAGELLRLALEARGEKGMAAPGRVRIALPYALVTSRFPAWWANWSKGETLEACLVSGNVHDMVASLVAGTVDLLVCFHTAEQPVWLEPGQFERAVLGEAVLRPQAVPALAAEWPGAAGRAIPLLLYPPTVYFGRLVALAMEACPALHGRRAAECDMADGLRAMAQAGLGVAWLPDAATGLVPVGEGSCDVALSIVAYRARGSGGALDTVWARANALAGAA